MAKTGRAVFYALARSASPETPLASLVPFHRAVPTRLVLARWYLYPVLPRNLRPRPSGFIEPCLPSPAHNPSAGDGWIHEIKHDSFRIILRRDTTGIRLLTRNGRSRELDKGQSRWRK
jgi:hypothetical protein